MVIEKQKIIGEKVRQARTLSKMTQEQLAKKIGIGRVVILKIESGQREARAGELESIAEVTNQPVSFFYDELEKPREFVKVTFAKGIRDLSDLSEKDLEVIDSVVRRLREKNTKDSES